jgi:hypothetical protein
MSTLATLAALVQDRLEEPRGPGVFWSLAGEIYPTLVEAMREAALITGEPEVRQAALFTLTSGTTFFTLPANAICLLRLQAPNMVQKTSVWDLDRDNSSWESDQGTVPDYWFPVGLTQFGIHPQLKSNIQANLTYIALPVPTGRPYTGAETVDFQQEFNEGFSDYSAHVLQLKEGGEEFVQSSKLYDRFLSRMTELSNFSYRKGSLRFTRSVGAPARVTPIERE